MTDETEPPFAPGPDPVKPTETVSTQTKTETVTSGPVKPHESMLLNMSVRAWIGMIIVVTMCVLCFGVVFLPVVSPTAATVLTTASIPDVFKDAFLVTITFYYSQANKPKSQTP